MFKKEKLSSAIKPSNIIEKYISGTRLTFDDHNDFDVLFRLFPSYEEKLEKILKYYNIIIQCLEIVNFLVFLQRGVFPILTHRILGLRLRYEFLYYIYDFYAQYTAT